MIMNLNNKKLNREQIEILILTTYLKMSSSICIPRIESSISKDYVEKVISNLRIGYIERITEIPLRNDPTHKRIIIKINWNKNQKAMNIQTILKNTGSIKLVYDNNSPWYWKIVNTSPQI
jgi:hypothetical protein